ncbi:MAG: aminotransferase class V-fold PLP-dependent enzyme [Rikenellaceae bacterium]|jgi:O-acetylhomoserine (thiol)-lyase|nr:aminotransferase class V-fold PLP-dependent enzyme [Rikenellaceae bacterium]
MNDLHFSTRIIGADYEKPDAHGALSLPVYRNAAFEFADSESIAAAFRGETGEHTYSRISNPSVAHFERKILAASGAASVIALSSGMAAITNTFFAIAAAGNNIVASPHLFGNTFAFFNSTLAFFGVEVRWVDAADLQQIAEAVDENTCAFFVELITNPHMEIADLPAISNILKSKGVPLIVDTTLVPWCAFDARRFGVDIEVVSTTKYISGGATGTGGVIVDHGTFDWTKNRKLAAMPEPPAVSRFTAKLRGEIVRNLGGYMTPDTAWQQSLGMDTLGVRFQRMSATAHALARHFENHPKVVRMGYTALESSPYKSLSDAFFTGDPGAMFTMELASQDDCFRFMDALKLFRRATNLFDNRSLVIHPFSTIYCTFTPQMKRTAGITDNLIRFSAGLEEVEDLKRDIENALKLL